MATRRTLRRRCTWPHMWAGLLLDHNHTTVDTLDIRIIDHFEMSIHISIVIRAGCIRIWPQAFDSAKCVMSRDRNSTT